eukprot:TRINITY_DN50151_c0_g1_i1.p1 TRINITY_DN50151_c0_g1~~TRINITY_DN50151_c0_g1_i1.p1  ORF type:complete len:276 (+),score=79.94 TRINITY_DN50151_c0_g1_i1:94-921(+)
MRGAAGLAMATAVVGAAAVRPVNLTLRSQYMSPVGKQQWETVNAAVSWDPAQTAIVVVDMWDKHWCPSATTRVAEIASPMEQFVEAARGFGLTVVWAPSDVTDFYTGTPARSNTLALPNATLPNATKVTQPTLPLSTNTRAGCDTNGQEHQAWKRQIATLVIHDTDFLISAQAGTQELWNIISARGLRNLIYLGVHENMCILGRPFAIEKVHSWGWTKENTVVVRDLVDVMYTPEDPPYVSHARGLQIHTDYVERFWASSISMYDILAPFYNSEL